MVEDKEDIRELIRYNLVQEGYQIRGILFGEETMKRNWF